MGPETGLDSFPTGRSEAWLSRGFWGAETPGSNPGAPIDRPLNAGGRSGPPEGSRSSSGTWFSAHRASRDAILERLELAADRTRTAHARCTRPHTNPLAR